MIYIYGVHLQRPLRERRDRIERESVCTWCVQMCAGRKDLYVRAKAVCVYHKMHFRYSHVCVCPVLVHARRDKVHRVYRCTRLAIGIYTGMSDIIYID